MENKEKIEITEAKIDVDVLDIMKSKNVLTALEDEKQLRRLELNFFCEMLSEFKKFAKSIDDFSKYISMVSADKLTAYFKEVRENVAKEQKLQEIIHEGHKKPKKINKK